MNVRTDTPFQASLEQTVHGAVGRLIERATTEPVGAGRTPWLRWLLAIAAVFLAWKVWRGFKSMFWTLFGLGMAAYWTGMWDRLF